MNVRGRRWLFAGIVLAITALAGAFWLWPAPIERAAHPARYAITGRSLLDLDAYGAAVRRRLKPGIRIVRMTLPEQSDGPVIVAVTDAGGMATTRLFLDPPTARLLDAPRTDAPTTPRPISAPALAIDVVAARALALAPGRVLDIIWPTEDRPDWTVVVSGRRVVTVADDSATVAFARRQPMTPARLGASVKALGGGGPWPIEIGATALVLTAALAVALWRRARRRRPPPTRARIVTTAGR